MKFFALTLLTLGMGCLSACSSGDDDFSDSTEPTTSTESNPSNGNSNSNSSSNGNSNSDNNNSSQTYEPSKLTLVATNNLTSLGFPHGSYSGITPLGNGEYAIVDDHALYGGIFTLSFTLNSKGEINEKSLSRNQLEGTTFRADGNYGGDENWRDPEGIVYHPSTDTYFVAHERYQKITEYDRKGKDTGRSLNVPQIFDYTQIQEAFGFESLAYNANTGLFWTTTEKALTADKTEANNCHKLRLQSFGEDLQPGKQLIYQTETLNSNAYTQGVSDILALDDGRLIVIEREVEVYTEQLAQYGIQVISPIKYNTKTRLYLVDPRNVSDGEQVTKTLLTEFDTKVDNISTPSLADFEGICLGPKLNDGRQTILLLSDTQNGMGGSVGSITITMQEYLKVFALE